MGLRPLRRVLFRPVVVAPSPHDKNLLYLVKGLGPHNPFTKSRKFASFSSLQPFGLGKRGCALAASKLGYAHCQML